MLGLRLMGKKGLDAYKQSEGIKHTVYVLKAGLGQDS